MEIGLHKTEQGHRFLHLMAKDQDDIDMLTKIVGEKPEEIKHDPSGILAMAAVSL